MRHQSRNDLNSLNKKQFENRNQTDEQLWTSIQKGRTEAMALLFNRYYSMLFDYAIKMTHREDWAKDAIQAVFVNLWEKRIKLSFTNSLKSYLFSSVRNGLLNEISRKKNHLQKQEEFHRHIPTNAFSPEEMLLSKERAERKKWIVEQALKKIPPRQREILYLKVFDNLSYREISAITNIAPQTARNHVCQAYQRLYVILSAEKMLTE